MLDSVAAAPPDPILGLSEAFQRDERPDKVNLTIGVFRDEQGQTPVLECVKRAERKLLDAETSKGYLGIAGYVPFQSLARDLVLGDLVESERVAAFQTPGGTGALRVAADFLSNNFSGAKVWMTTPTWPNHPAVFGASGLESGGLRYLAADKTRLDVEGYLEDIDRQTSRGDIICLHACCHNPTGVDPSAEQWDQIARLTAERGLLPLIDFAYQGFGEGLDEDRVGLRALSQYHDEYLVCSSYSKNFGLYSERVGALLGVCRDADSAAAVTSSLKQSVRCNYSNPPRHGGAIVGTILEDQELTELWRGELTQMRQRIRQMREQLVEALQSQGCQQDFSFLLNQRGMFSFSGLTPVQADWLRTEKAVYVLGSGRINVAGITPDNLERLSQAIAEVVGQVPVSS